MLVVQATNAYVHRASGYQAEGGGRKAVGRVIDQPNQGVTLTTNFHTLPPEINENLSKKYKQYNSKSM